MRRIVILSLCLLIVAVALTGCAKVAYVASKGSDRFHTPTCVWAKQIQSERRITFATREEAVKAGLTPCPVCNP